MTNKITASFEGCKANIDDVIVFGTWKQHLERSCELFRRAAKLTVNFVKSDFGHALLSILGTL